MEPAKDEITALVPYSLEAATVEVLKSKYMDVTIQPDDKAAYAMVMGGLRECREIRLAVDAWHKEKKEWIVKAGKHYDTERRRVHALIAPIEDHLSEVRKAEDDRKEAIKAEAERKELERVKRIRTEIEYIKSYPLRKLANRDSSLIKGLIEQLTAIAITPERYQEFESEAQLTKTQALEILNQQYTERVQWEQEQAAANAEAERLAKIKAEQEAERKRIEEEALKLREVQAKIEAERKALEAAQRAEQERKDREEFERRAREDAKARAEAEAKAKVDREAKEKAEREEKERVEKARQEAMRPDKEKLIAWASTLDSMEGPDLISENARNVREWALTQINKTARGIIKQAKEL